MSVCCGREKLCITARRCVAHGTIQSWRTFPDFACPSTTGQQTRPCRLLQPKFPSGIRHESKILNTPYGFTNHPIRAVRIACGLHIVSEKVIFSNLRCFILKDESLYHYRCREMEKGEYFDVLNIYWASLATLRSILRCSDLPEDVLELDRRGPAF